MSTMDETMSSSQRQAVIKAVDGLGLTPEDRSAYDQAIAKVPFLVMQESDPAVFFQYQQGNTEAAAQGLVSYWKERHATFGQDRFLLPLFDLSGETGALTLDDVATLNTGFLSFLPNDSLGRTVLFFDNSKRGALLDGNTRRAPRSRCLFYVSSIAAFDKNKNKPVVLLRHSDSAKMYLRKAERILRLFSQCLPVNLDLLLNLYLSPPGARRMFEKTVVCLFEDFPGREQYRDVLKSFIGDSPQELLQKVVPFGLTRECLPPCVGGTWQGAEEKIQVQPDYTSPYSHLKQSPAAASVSSHEETDNSNNKNKRKSPDANDEMDEMRKMKARAERKRMMDRKYSESRRQREKMGESGLYNQYVQLNAKNKGLRREQARLEGLLKEAEKMVSDHHLEQRKNEEHEEAFVLPQEPSASSMSVAQVEKLLLLQQQAATRALLEAALRNNAPIGAAHPATTSSTEALLLQLLSQQRQAPGYSHHYLSPPPPLQATPLPGAPTLVRPHPYNISGHSSLQQQLQQDPQNNMMMLRQLLGERGISNYN